MLHILYNITLATIFVLFADYLFSRITIDFGAPKFVPPSPVPPSPNPKEKPKTTPTLNLNTPAAKEKLIPRSVGSAALDYSNLTTRELRSHIQLWRSQGDPYRQQLRNAEKRHKLGMITALEQLEHP